MKKEEKKMPIYCSVYHNNFFTHFHRQYAGIQLIHIV